MPPERILGKVVDCDKFQDARKFLINGGEKGRQLGILTAGTYRINTAVFTVITAHNADQNEMDPEDLHVYSVEPDMVGIVTTLDGAPIAEGEIAGLYLPNHDNFQNAQAFMDSGRSARLAGAGLALRLVEPESLVRARRASADDRRFRLAMSAW